MMITFSLIGSGNRGMIYAELLAKSGQAQILALAEPNAERRSYATAKLHIGAKHSFPTDDAFFAQGKLSDVCIIASMDRSHYSQAMRALALGYDLLLEKPISPDAAECQAISRKAKELGRKVVVCHVLRYTPMYRAVKAFVDSGRFGRIIDIQHNENIGNFHMAHFFVRGNWRNASQSSPIILQKTCHDMDLLVWLTGSRCKRVSSFGELVYFRNEYAPEGSGERCAECAVAKNCRFEAAK